jgi:protein required for attachment to host cells
MRAYDSLVIVAPPQFLGLLRHVVSDHVKSHSVLWLDKDLTHHPLHQIETDVAGQLRA